MNELDLSTAVITEHVSRQDDTTVSPSETGHSVQSDGHTCNVVPEMDTKGRLQSKDCGVSMLSHQDFYGVVQSPPSTLQTALQETDLETLPRTLATKRGSLIQQ